MREFLDCGCPAAPEEVPTYLRALKYHSDVTHRVRDIVQRLPWHQVNATVDTNLLRDILKRLIELEDAQ